MFDRLLSSQDKLPIQGGTSTTGVAEAVGVTVGRGVRVVVGVRVGVAGMGVFVGVGVIASIMLTVMLGAVPVTTLTKVLASISRTRQMVLA